MIGIFLILLIAGIFVYRYKLTGNAINDNAELEKYRSESIPEQCRLPEYEDDLNWWKQHLSHHTNTLYCLEYYK